MLRRLMLPGLPVTVVRPSAVYGERDRLMAPRIARLISTRLAFVLGSGENTLSTVYAGNVADAILLIMKAGAGEAVYDVGLDHPLTQRQLLEGLAAGLGWSLRILRIPKLDSIIEFHPDLPTATSLMKRRMRPSSA